MNRTQQGANEALDLALAHKATVRGRRAMKRATRAYATALDLSPTGLRAVHAQALDLIEVDGVFVPVATDWRV